MQNITHFAGYGGVFFRKSQAYMKAAFKKLGLSFLEAVVLVNVCENPGIIQEKAAYNLALDDAAVARSLKQMETAGLIRRVIDGNNQRTKKVYARPAGEICKKKIDLAMDHWNSIILKDFTEKERANIIVALQLLRQKVIDVDLSEALKTLSSEPVPKPG